MSQGRPHQTSWNIFFQQFSADCHRHSSQWIWLHAIQAILCHLGAISHNNSDSSPLKTPFDNFHFHQCAIVLVREGLYIYLHCFLIFWKFNCVASLILCICRRQFVYNCYKICCRTSYKDVLVTVFRTHWSLSLRDVLPVWYKTTCVWLNSMF